MASIQVAEHAFKLRPYQAEDRLAVADAFLNKGITRALGVWPTAGGKTVMFSELHLEPSMQAWLNNYPLSQQKILVVAHREELLSQAKDKILRANPNLIVEIEQAGNRASVFADVVVASIQTLVSARGKRLKKFNPDQFRIVVVDEAHHAASPSYLTVLQYFGFLPPPHFMEETRPPRASGKAALLEWQRNKLATWDSVHQPDKLLLGVTATPKRGDNIGLEAVFQFIVFNRSIRELMENGYLCRLKAYRVLTDTSLDEVSVRAGDFAQDALGETVNRDPRNAKAVRAYLDYAAGRKGVTFCVNVAHAHAMAATYRAAGVSAEAIHGGLNSEKREDILNRFRSGEITMLANCQILTEGTDIPDIECIVHARPTKSSLLYIQMTGRGLRLSPGKENCVIIDIVDITRKHSLISAPELLGLPVSFDAKGGDLLEAKVKMEESAKANPMVDLEGIQSLDDIQIRVKEVDLLDSFHDQVLDTHAKLGWRKTGEGYELSWRGPILSEAMEIIKTDSGWVAQHRKDAKEERTHWKAEAPSAEAAISQAEAYIKQQVDWVYRLNKKDGPWRSQPATQLQKDNLRKMGYNVNLDTIKRGEANQLIDLWFKRQGVK